MPGATVQLPKRFSLKEDISMDQIKKLQQIIDNTDNIVFFGGAGVSTESGIPDFRSKDGLYNQKYDYPPETILSHDFYVNEKEVFFRFYRDKIIGFEARPNKAHIKLAELEQAGKLRAVVTQNIDGLHQAAGSKKVLELHGGVSRNYCEACGSLYDVEHMKKEGLPRCGCGGFVKPDVVLYGEMLDNDVMEEAVGFISNADVLIIGGTSLVVYPAAGLIRYFRGSKLVMINRDITGQEGEADLVIKGSIGEVLGEIRVN